MDAFALRGVGWLDNPYISFWLCLLKLLVVSMEVMKFCGQDVGIWYEVEL